jgi:hypothetical protein
MHHNNIENFNTRRMTAVNPLTPELNPSAQRCLPRFFTGDFSFSRAYCATSL